VSDEYVSDVSVGVPQVIDNSLNVLHIIVQCALSPHSSGFVISPEKSKSGLITWRTPSWRIKGPQKPVEPPSDSSQGVEISYISAALDEIEPGALPDASLLHPKERRNLT